MRSCDSTHPAAGLEIYLDDNSVCEVIDETDDHDIILMREPGGFQVAVGVVTNFELTDAYFLKALQDFIDRVKAGEIRLSDSELRDDGLH